MKRKNVTVGNERKTQTNGPEQTHSKQADRNGRNKPGEKTAKKRNVRILDKIVNQWTKNGMYEQKWREKE